MRKAWKAKAPGFVVALALTWDGARWPVRKLPKKARDFLGIMPRRIKGKRELTELFQSYQVKELRLCWIPRLTGSDNVLSDPFIFQTERRLSFRITRVAVFGDALGVIYKR